MIRLDILLFLALDKHLVTVKFSGVDHIEDISIFSLGDDRLPSFELAFLHGVHHSGFFLLVQRGEHERLGETGENTVSGFLGFLHHSRDELFL
jgi:hypothetical protein